MKVSGLPILKFLCLFIAISSTPLQLSAQSHNPDIDGIWKIKRFAGAADSFGLTQRQIDALIGQSIVISPEQFTFNGRTCKKAVYRRSVEETTTYFRREWQANASDLSLPNPVTIIHTGCNLLYPMRKDHLLIAEQSGVFFEAVRTKPYKALNSARASIAN